jgi:hypothetical protein
MKGDGGNLGFSFGRGGAAGVVGVGGMIVGVEGTDVAVSWDGLKSFSLFGFGAGEIGREGGF